MATQPKSLLNLTRRPLPGSRRIAQLADDPAVLEAQRWFARERTWLAEQHLAICRIPAPTFFEERRAAWLAEQLRHYGWDAILDRAGNVLATWREAGDKVLALTAHLDTVLAPQRPEDINVTPDGRVQGPGVSDNGSGLAALLTVARVLSENRELHGLASSLLIVANVGEEGEGNLSGMRYLCRQSAVVERIAAFVVLDGPSIEHITAQALSSRRYEINLQGPGGHSWNDQGTANPVHALSHAISSFVQAAESRNESGNSKFSYNFGIIEGGASVNSIPARALAKLDLRSEDEGALDDLSAILTGATERALEAENRHARNSRLNAPRLTAKIRELGARPGGRLQPDSPLLRTIQTVDSYLQIRSRINCASTDANIPLSLGLPAISIGTGGQGGGAHTAQEWFHAEGRETGLKRILLLLLALAVEMGDGQYPPANYQA